MIDRTDAQMRKEEGCLLWLLCTVHLILQFGFHYSSKVLSYKFARVLQWVKCLLTGGFKPQVAHFILFWDEDYIFLTPYAIHVRLHTQRLPES